MEKSYNTILPATAQFASFWSAEDTGNLIDVDATPEQQPKEEPQTPPEDSWSWGTDGEDDDGGDDNGGDSLDNSAFYRYQ